ncbi:T9SS type A sorting domain-containing protein [candidate division KSB1 bacterium]|nr:T9SS type A sorting domain-containing protein [candidate division KSB1 bacterium]
MIKVLRVLVLTAAIPMFFGSLGIVEAADLHRPYEPVIISGSDIPAADLPIDELFVYAYRTGGWHQIPFQIDERDGRGYFFGAKNGILDATDEICFMNADLGDSVGSTVWIADAESRAYTRFQITLVDTSVIPARRAHAYLYRSSTLSRTHTSYMTYTAPTGEALAPPTRYTNFVGDDEIQAVSYAFKHDQNGIPVDLRILASVGGNPAIDLLDRWKVFAKGTLFVGEYTATEETGLDSLRLDVVAGPVRVLRRATYSLSFEIRPSGMDPFIAAIPDSVSFVAQFYPYTYYVNSFARKIEETYGMEILRETMDFSSEISGSKFYSEFNPAEGFTVEGFSAAGSDEEDYIKTFTVPDYNWYLLNGDRGTIAAVTWVPNIGEAQELYYRDSLIPRLYDTGDAGNYGECGLTIKSTGSPIVVTQDSMQVWRYFLGPQHTRELGDTLLALRKNPLMTQATAKTFVVPVELAAFSAAVVGNTVELAWRTQSESKNYGFEILRADEASDWQVISFVRGKGTTNRPQSYSFTDQTLAVGLYRYRLKQIDTDGTFELSHSVQASIQAPSLFALEQNFPNPFNPATEIAFQIPDDHQGQVVLRIHNLIGQVIRTLVDSELTPGYYRFKWDGTSDNGEMTGSGAYFYRLQAGEYTATRKLVKLQ